MEELRFGKKDMKGVHVTVVGKYVNTTPMVASNVRYEGELGENVQEALDALSAHNVTYEELVGMVRRESLVVGAKYRITDYVTTVGSNEYQSIKKPFDIIVEAETSKTLSSNAKAVPSDRDTDNYFQYCDLSKWELKYDINNDVGKYAWADPNGKGVIYYMKDDRENECPYDFKNIKVKPLSESNYYFTFTLNNTDYSISDTKGCYNNIIKERRAFDTGCLHIPSIVIIAKGENPIFNCIENTFGYDCDNIVIKEGAARNTFGSECYDIRCNYIGGSTFGNQCKRLYFDEGNDSYFGTYISNFNFVDSTDIQGSGSFEGIIVDGNNYNNDSETTVVKGNTKVINAHFKAGIIGGEKPIELDNTSSRYLTTVERSKDGDIVVYTDNAGDLKKKFDEHVDAFNTLVSGNVVDTIDNFNEVINFLEGVNDDEKLTGKLTEINKDIDNLYAYAKAVEQDYLAADNTFRNNLNSAKQELQGKIDKANSDINSLNLQVSDNLTYINDVYEELKAKDTQIENSITSTKKDLLSNIAGVESTAQDNINYLVQTKQDKLVSGDNIKTINGESLLGEGDLVVATKINPNLMMNTGFHGDITQVWNTDVKTNSYNPRTDVDGVRNLVLSNGQYIQQDVNCNPGVYTLSFRMKASGSYVPMYLWDVANGYNVNILAKSDEITQRSGVGEYRIYTEGSEYRDYFITFEVGHSSPALEVKFGGNTNVPWVYISAIKLEEGDVVTQYVSHVDDYASAYGNSGESFSGDAEDVTYSGNVNASNVKDALDLLSTTMITTEPAEGEVVDDYVLMASDVAQSLGDSVKPISQAAVKSAINSIESMIVSVINTPT